MLIPADTSEISEIRGGRAGGHDPTDLIRRLLHGGDVLHRIRHPRGNAVHVWRNGGNAARHIGNTGIKAIDGLCELRDVALRVRNARVKAINRLRECREVAFRIC